MAATNTTEYRHDLNSLVSRYKDLHLEYTKPHNYGSEHRPNWLVKALVNGYEHGEGYGTTKDGAREMAAGQALNALRAKDYR